MLTGFKYLSLYIRRQLTVYGQHHNGRHTLQLSDPVSYQEACCLYVLLSCHENQDVTWAVLEVDRQCLLDGCIHVVFGDHLCEVLLHGEGTAGDREDRDAPEKITEFLCVHSG